MFGTAAVFQRVAESDADYGNRQRKSNRNPRSPLNPPLDVLRLNGGTTPTHGFLSMSSPAVDKGNNFGLTTDQPGQARPVDNQMIADAAAGDGANLGAFEVPLTPTAAGVAISGRVTVGSRGLTNATVYLTGETGKIRTARTTAFGYFHFENIAAGQNDVAAVVSKHCRFEPQVLSENGEMTDLHLIAEPLK